MLRLMSSLFGLLFLLVIGALILLGLLRDAEPSLQSMPVISAEQRRWGMELLQRGFMEADGEEAESISMTPADLNILSALLAESIPDSRLQMHLDEGSAEIRFALRLPNALEGWLNLRARLVAPDGQLAVEAVQVGSLKLPPALTELIVDQLLAAMDLPVMPQGIVFTPEAVRWQAFKPTGTGIDWLATVLTSGTKTSILVAQRRLADLSILRTNRRRIDAAELLSALLAAVPADAPDPVDENRALILALALYVNGRSLPDPSGSPPPRPIRLSMRGRKDIAQHFFTSGALFLQGGSRLANLIGFAKELDDAKGSSGFSFKDIAANRAGIRFAQLATADPEAARRMQAQARRGLSQADIMPAVDWLPESMSRAIFERDFGGGDDPAYRILINEIDRRIEALPIVDAVKKAL
ncbi:MAG: hypothetical protein VBE63_02570 [Lamprobacter sp.]|uniref:hypothetical protein n=1 Tax=Lamprobacter sp. TaxID=3100796 RepID=UPI002B259156|nr:hypothetical protein [Lamprobacter sp.]MEA3638809.1 hypothetical protein [Lamprobacter sp.]